MYTKTTIIQTQHQSPPNTDSILMPCAAHSTAASLGSSSVKTAAAASEASINSFADALSKLSCSPPSPSVSGTTSNSSSGGNPLDYVDASPDATDEYLQFSSYINRGLSERQVRELFYTHYLLGQEIGKGGFGTIFSGLRRAESRPVAIKVIKKSKITQWYDCCDRSDDAVVVGGSEDVSATANDPIVTKRIPLEIALMIRVRDCEHCISILDYLEQRSCFIIVMERLERCKDLFDLITEFSVTNGSSRSDLSMPIANSSLYGLDEGLARDYFRQIVDATVAILSLGVLHRDIKDENILIDLNTNRVKLIDFGAGTFLNETRNFSDFHGTRVYSPPEWILNKSYYGDRACVWSLGVLLFNMIYGDIPWEEDADIVNCRLFNSKKFNFNFNTRTTTDSGNCNINDINDSNNNSMIGRDVDDLIRSCLTIDDKKRIKLEDILKHKWFRSVS